MQKGSSEAVEKEKRLQYKLKQQNPWRDYINNAQGGAARLSI